MGGPLPYQEKALSQLEGCAAPSGGLWGRGGAPALARKNQGPKECPRRNVQEELYCGVSTGTCLPRDTASGQGLTWASQDHMPSQALWGGPDVQVEGWLVPQTHRPLFPRRA